MSEREWTEEDRLKAQADARERDERRIGLEAAYGKPRRVDAADAVALAKANGTEVPENFRLDWMVAHLYRDRAAADVWLASNSEHHGHPTLFRTELPDGQVIGVLDLRVAMERALREPDQA